MVVLSDDEDDDDEEDRSQVAQRGVRLHERGVTASVAVLPAIKEHSLSHLDSD